MRTTLFCCAAAVASCTAAAPPRSGAPGDEPPRLQLGRDVVPERYELALDVDPAKDSFSGTAAIHVRVDKPRSSIWMHALKLRVTSAEVESAGARRPAKLEQVDDDGLARLVLDGTLAPGPAVLRFAWSAPFDAKANGVYVGRSAGVPYAGTQFEAIYARRAFPSFDDPQFKTPFALTLTIPAGQLAVANTDAVEEAPSGQGHKRIAFAPTRPLPTYLLAFAVGPFDVAEAPPLPPDGVRKRPLRTRGFATKGRSGELQAALDASNALVPIMERYFGMEFPYPKLDHVGLPDFEAGAMENAGIITYRETALLFRPGFASEERRTRIEYTVAHEVAHQWFGDLVTLPWWTDAWLNEGFATWMARKAMRTWKPEEGKAADVLAVGWPMYQDQLVAARPIRQPLERISDVWNQFDSLAYGKSAALLRMFETYASPEKFQRGIQAYVRAHADGTGTTDSLLRHLEEAAGKPVAAPFRTFLDQAGVPLVEASLDCQEGKAQLKLRQKRYLPRGSRGDPEKGLWQIPVCVHAGGERDATACTLLTSREGTLDLGEGCPAWVVPKADAAGYYRWALSPEALAKLMRDGWAKLGLRERLDTGVQMMAAAQAGAISRADALRYLAPMAADEMPEIAHLPVWPARFLAEHLAGPLRPQAQAFVAALYKPVYARLGWQGAKGEPSERRSLRSDVLSLLAFEAQDAEVRAEAARRGRAYVEGGVLHPEAVPPAAAGLALRVAMEEDKSLFETVWKLIDGERDAGIRSRLVSALVAVRDPALRERAFNLAFDPRFQSGDRGEAFNAAFFIEEAREPAWRWLRDNLDRLLPMLPTSHQAHLAAALHLFCDEPKRAEAYAVLSARADKVPGLRKELALADESVRLCIAQKEADAESARGFLREWAAKR